MPIASLVEQVEETCERIFWISKASLHFMPFMPQVRPLLLRFVSESQVSFTWYCRWDLQQCWVPPPYIWMTLMYLFTMGSSLHQELAYYSAANDANDHDGMIMMAWVRGSWGIGPSTRKAGYDSAVFIKIGWNRWKINPLIRHARSRRASTQLAACRAMPLTQCTGPMPDKFRAVLTRWALSLVQLCGIGGQMSGCWIRKFIWHKTTCCFFCFGGFGRLRMRGLQAVEAFANLMVPKDWIWTRGTWDTLDTCNSIGDGETVWR